MQWNAPNAVFSPCTWTCPLLCPNGSWWRPRGGGGRLKGGNESGIAAKRSMHKHCTAPQPTHLCSTAPVKSKSFLNRIFWLRLCSLHHGCALSLFLDVPAPRKYPSVSALGARDSRAVRCPRGSHCSLRTAPPRRVRSDYGPGCAGSFDVPRPADRILPGHKNIRDIFLE